MVLDSLGYQVPFLDYKSILNGKLTKHIHWYTCNINVTSDNIYITLSLNKKIEFYLTIFRRNNDAS